MTPHDPTRRLQYDSLARPVAVLAQSLRDGTSIGWHAHPKGQLLYAIEGVMVVHTEAGSWIVPPNRGLWMVAGLRHTVTMSGDVFMRTAYIDAEQIGTLPKDTCVIAISPLLRELLVEAALIPLTHEPTGRDARLISLLIDEIRVSTTLPLYLPMPDDERLRQICKRLIEQPADLSSASDWASMIQVSERTLHRLFVKGTGMTFAQWREQARLLYALKRIASGGKVIDVALDCGYGSASAFSAMFKRHFGVSPSGFYR